MSPALSEEQVQHAIDLHNESFIFDFFPRSEPAEMTSEETAQITEWLEAGESAGGVLDKIFSNRTLEMETDTATSDRVRDYWKASGISGLACTLGGLDNRYDAHESVVRTIARWNSRFAVADWVTLCRSASDLEKAHQEGKLGMLLALQDTIYIEDDLSNINVLYEFGVRMIQLTYNLRNLLGDGCTERVQSGLSILGAEAVKRMNQLGILVDLSHCGIQTTFDALELSEQPVAFSHTGCRALYDHPRNKTDDQLRALAEKDGYVGIYVVPGFLGVDPSEALEAMLDHLQHAIEIVGPSRVGIGTDWGAWSADIPEPLRIGLRQEFMRRGFRAGHGLSSGIAVGDMDSYTKLHLITCGLLSRGFSDDEIKGILGKNFLDFMKRAGAA